MSTEPSIFTRIINREIPAHIVYEDDVCICILDKFPGITGQSLVIPKVPVSYVFDLDDTTYQHIFMVAKKIARVLDQVFDTERTCLVVEGFEVSHVHIKLYPMPKNHLALGQVLSSSSEESDSTLQEIAKTLIASLT